MDALLAILKDFWPQILTGVSVGLIALFNKKIIEWITLFIRVIITSFRKKLSLKLTCPVPGIQLSLDAIRAELHPNGGSSLRDAVNRIDRRTKDMEPSIRRLNISHEVLTEVVDVPFFRSDANGNTTYCSNSLCRLAGMSSSKEYMGMNWLTYVHEDDLEHAREGWLSAIKEKRTYIGTFRIINPYSNKIYKITEKATPVLGDDNEIFGWEGVIIKYEEIK
jgi:PAS domain S-box-containing protein